MAGEKLVRTAIPQGAGSGFDDGKAGAQPAGPAARAFEEPVLQIQCGGKGGNRLLPVRLRCCDDVRVERCQGSADSCGAVEVTPPGGLSTLLTGRVAIPLEAVDVVRDAGHHPSFRCSGAAPPGKLAHSPPTTFRHQDDGSELLGATRPHPQLVEVGVL